MSRKLKDAIAQLAGTFNKDLVSITACTVQSVNMNVRQCTCMPLTGSSSAAFTVNLSAEPNDGILVTPSVGSTVLVAQTIQNAPFVLMYSDVDAFQVIQGDIELNISGGKIAISNSGCDLKTQLDNLIQAITELTVPTAWGPSGTPINASAFTDVQTALDNLLASSNA